MREYHTTDAEEVVELIRFWKTFLSSIGVKVFRECYFENVGSTIGSGGRVQR